MKTLIKITERINSISFFDSYSNFFVTIWSNPKFIINPKYDIIALIYTNNPSLSIPNLSIKIGINKTKKIELTMLTELLRKKFSNKFGLIFFNKKTSEFKNYFLELKTKKII